MTLQNIPLFQAMNAKMNYLEKRQALIAENIANSDTPNYRARDLSKVDFSSVLKDVTKTNKITMAATQAGHIGGGAGNVETAKDIKQKVTYEVTPDGNAIDMEEQMVKANEVNMEYTLLTNLIRKQSNMIRTALGRGQ